eukprot:GHVO01000010.1.p1 GENE.GHVO01000010.1~~GHVO01000010.1.p1  ORF type:complete len:152 (-),score=14.77 GHVO01000010.1:74-502(-)
MDIELSISFRFLKDGCSHTDFLTVVSLNDGKSNTITAAIISLLDRFGLQLEKMCAFGSDGAPALVGQKNGVAGQLKAKIPHMVNNHCVAHRLALEPQLKFNMEAYPLGDYPTASTCAMTLPIPLAVCEIPARQWRVESRPGE